MTENINYSFTLKDSIDAFKTLELDGLPCFFSKKSATTGFLVSTSLDHQVYSCELNHVLYFLFQNVNAEAYKVLGNTIFFKRKDDIEAFTRWYNSNSEYMLNTTCDNSPYPSLLSDFNNKKWPKIIERVVELKEFAVKSWTPVWVIMVNLGIKFYWFDGYKTFLFQNSDDGALFECFINNKDNYPLWKNENSELYITNIHIKAPFTSLAFPLVNNFVNNKTTI